MNIILLIIIGFVVFFSLLFLLNKKSKECEDLTLKVNAMQGITPGGIYHGIMFFPGDSAKDWIKKEKYGTCPACGKGMLFYYWQDEYYRMQCDSCGYLHDTGQKLPPEVIEANRKMMANVHESEKFM